MNEYPQNPPIQATVCRKHGIISIGIFGSVARGEQHEGSDLDVF